MSKASLTYMRQYVRCRYIALKLKAIAYKGGKCVCGYDKCPAALVFHHRDPKEKEFDWNRMKRQSWETIKLELDKCDLLCCRCHAELHYDTRLTDEALQWLADRKSQDVQLQKCNVCSTVFIKHSSDQKYCTPECSHQAQLRAIYPPDSEFIAMVDEIGRVKVGKLFGVSDRAISKRYNKIKIHQISSPHISVG